jgi:hypothetical protein
MAKGQLYYLISKRLKEDFTAALKRRLNSSLALYLTKKWRHVEPGEKCYFTL